ncbi:MAG: LysR family transcriptional regulator [Sphingorhabdus sp.]
MSDPRGYASFLAVARHGGINAAARHLGKAPSAIHYDLKQLETRLGAAIFERIGRQLRMTQAGRLLFETVSRALEDISRAENRFASRSDLLPLRIASVSGFGRYRLMPNLLAAMPADRALELSFGTHEDVVTAVTSGRVEYGITFRGVELAELGCEQLAQEELVLLGSSGKANPPHRIEGAPFITYDEYDYVFSRWFAEAPNWKPSVLRRMDHFSELEEALSSVAAGRGYTIAPKDCWINGPYRRQLKTFGPEGACVNAVYILNTKSSLNSGDIALISMASAI